VNDQLERMWKKAVVAYFKVLSRHSPGGTEENHEILSQDSRCPVRYLNTGLPEYEAGVLCDSRVMMLHRRNGELQSE
jgi:hypothetical protein